MNILIEDHLEALTALLKHDVSFILIGGHAVIYHGYERTTGDMDIWLNPVKENMKPLLLALEEIGIDESGLEQIRLIDLTSPQVFFIGEKPKRIDFLTKVVGLKFSEAIKEIEYFELHELQVPVIHYNHLIQLKSQSGRLKDQADVEELQKIRKYKNDHRGQEPDRAN